MDDQPKCDQKHTIQECSGILYSTECCNGNENQVQVLFRHSHQCGV